jgi:hypothetical protein
MLQAALNSELLATRVFRGCSEPAGSRTHLSEEEEEEEEEVTADAELDEHLGSVLL